MNEEIIRIILNKVNGFYIRLISFVYLIYLFFGLNIRYKGFLFQLLHIHKNIKEIKYLNIPNNNYHIHYLIVVLFLIIALSDGLRKHLAIIYKIILYSLIFVILFTIILFIKTNNIIFLIFFILFLFELIYLFIFKDKYKISVYYNIGQIIRMIIKLYIVSIVCTYISIFYIRYHNINLFSHLFSHIKESVYLLIYIFSKYTFLDFFKITSHIDYINESILNLILNIISITLLIVSLFVLSVLKYSRYDFTTFDKVGFDIYKIYRNSYKYNSLSYFSLRDNKNIIWSNSKSTFIAFNVVSNYIIISGDPIGKESEFPEIMKQFIKIADMHSLEPVILSCSFFCRRIWLNTIKGLKAMEYSCESIVDISSFTLKGNRMKNLRQKYTRTLKYGYSFKIYTLQNITEKIRNQINEKIFEFCNNKEYRGYLVTLGRILGSNDDEVIVSVAYDNNDEIISVIQWVPWNLDGYTLDIMLRNDEFKYVYEFLIVEMINFFKERNIIKLSLNGIIFKNVYQSTNIFLKYASILLSKQFPMIHLYNFTKKFTDRWESNYILYFKYINPLSFLYNILILESLIPRVFLFRKIHAKIMKDKRLLNKYY